MVKGGLVLAAAFALTALVLWLQPRRAMNTGGCGPRALLAVARQFGNTQTEAQTLARFPNEGFEVTLSQLLQNRRAQVVDMHRVFDNVIAIIVGFAKHHAALDTHAISILHLQAEL